MPRRAAHAPKPTVATTSIQPEATPTRPHKPTEGVPPVNEPTHSRKPRIHKRLILALSIAAVAVGLIVLGGYLLVTVVKPRHDQTNKNTVTASAAATIQGIDFPVYYPSHLPTGYTYNNDAKVIENNVLYYSIKDSKGNIYHVTLQPLPSSFNFSTFKDKFVKPDQYATNVGSVIAGQVGANIIGSIQSSDNVWIIVNSTAKNSLPELEAITRSFERAK